VRAGRLAVAAILGGIVGSVGSLLSWRGAMPEAAPPDPGLYAPETRARGKILAAIGNCAVCHTRDGGVENAGGRPLKTPFGIIYSTNITPDEATGLGAWSFAAFARAMRSGLHRDGRHLYPAFPYTAYARLNDADLEAIYAYLMAQTPVVAAPMRNRLAFPFNLRPLLAGWNALFHRAEEYRADLTRGEVWNRGAYLVEGLGHCSACHAPRNMLGAERTGADERQGGNADGWEAPLLTGLSHAPVPWTEDDIFDYLSTGFSPLHGVAAGPMGPVVESLRSVPAGDIRAMAHYLASRLPPVTQQDAQSRAKMLEERASASLPDADGPGQSIYDFGCAVCHEPGRHFMFGIRPSLALNTNLYSARPDNLLRVILDGADTSGAGRPGAMPAFRGSLSNTQLADLLGYLRARFAPGQPAWSGIETVAGRIRAEAGGF